jgi:hypothetical protein
MQGRNTSAMMAMRVLVASTSRKDDRKYRSMMGHATAGRNDSPKYLTGAAEQGAGREPGRQHQTGDASAILRRHTQGDDSTPQRSNGATYIAMVPAPDSRAFRKLRTLFTSPRSFGPNCDSQGPMRRTVSQKCHAYCTSRERERADGREREVEKRGSVVNGRGHMDTKLGKSRG